MNENELKFRDIGKNISQINRFNSMHFSKVFSKFGIGQGQYGVLLNLYREDGITQEKLSEEMKVDKATVARAVKKLEDEGYIIRKKRKYDKRSYSIILTEKANKIENEVNIIMKNWENKIKNCLTEDESSHLLELLVKVNVGLY